MPKYKITEQDNTGSFSLNEQPNIVYIPGAAKSSVKTSAKLYNTASDFLKDIDEYTTDTSFYLALQLLRLGMQVVYQGFPLHSGTTVIYNNTFTINSIAYTYSSTNKSVTWVVGDLTKTAYIDGNNVVVLEGGLTAKIIGTAVTYPVAVRNVITQIELDTSTTNPYKYIIAKGIKFTVGQNQLGYSINDVAYTSAGINGTFIISDGVTESFTITVDYVNEVAYYSDVYVSDGSIQISDSDWKALEDKNLYNVRFLTTGGYAIPSESMISTAANRGDCVALIDHSNMETYSVADVRAEIEALKGATSSRQSDALAFASAFTPWFVAGLTDENGLSVDKEVPASFGYLFAYARSIQDNPVWKAVAGVFRGVIPELKDVSYILNNAECEMLGARAVDGEVDLDEDGDNAGIAINPIAYRRFSGFGGGYNYVINGNRTMHDNKGYTIATSFLNVRILISEISKSLYDASVAYTFEQNSNVLWNKFKALITPLLNRMQSGEGIEGYR